MKKISMIVIFFKSIYILKNKVRKGVNEGVKSEQVTYRLHQTGSGEQMTLSD